MGMTPQQIADKWSRNLGGSVESIKAGVNAVTVAPTEKALGRIDAYLLGVQEAVSSGKLQRGLQRVTLQDWKNAMLNKGVNRIATGASQAVPKFAAFMAEFMPHIEEGLRKLEAQPRGSLTENIQRMIAMVQHNAEFKRRA